MAKNHDSSSESVPFLQEWSHHELRPSTDEETELLGDPSTTYSVTFLGTCVNGLNALSGVGILSISYALASGGWLSLILLFVIAMTAFYSGMLIKRCMDMNCNIRTYPDIGALAFGKVLLIIFVVSTAGYASMAIIGYLMFGPEVESQITLNLPINKISSKVAIYATLVNPLCKYALMMTPITAALKALLPQKHKNRLTCVLISTSLVISSAIVALTVPFFGYLTSLVGALLSMTASILLPCICYLKIASTYGKLGCEKVAIVTIILLGVVIGILGTYTSLVQIIDHL